MAAIPLRAVSRTQGNNQALKDHTVTPSHFTLEFEEVPVLVHAFRRMVRELAYDVCEMALTTYLCAREHGTRFTALPVFLVRGFHHGAVLHTGRIAHPKDLEGRRVGVNRGYTVTTGVWARAVLQEEYGVDLSRVTWVLSGDEHVAQYRPPGNVVPARCGGDLAGMLLDGEVDATIGVSVDHPDARPLIPDPAEAGLTALRERGLYPINHLVVVRDDLLDAHPHLAADVFGAFADAKKDYVDRLLGGSVSAPSPTDLMYQRVAGVTGADPLPYGVEPNRATIERIIEHALDQRILRNRPDVDALFANGTHDRTA